MILLQMNFDFDKDMMGDRLSEHGRPLAESLNMEKGFISKIWTENPETGKAGGIHLFDNIENASNFAINHRERLTAIGASNIEFRFFDVNEPLSKINKGI